MEVLAAYAVIIGIAANGEIRDRRFPAEGAILTVEADRLECPPVELEPRFVGNLIVPIRDGDLIRIFLGQLSQPIARARRPG